MKLYTFMNYYILRNLRNKLKSRIKPGKISYFVLKCNICWKMYGKTHIQMIIFNNEHRPARYLQFDVF